MGAFVIKSWKSGNKPVDEQGNYVHIVGRNGGLIAWLLARLRVDPTTRIAVGIERLEFTRSSLSGVQARLIPLESISSTYYGYHKPWKTALSIVLLFGLVAGSLMREPSSGTIGAVVIGFGLLFAAAYYLLNRTLTLGFIEHSGVVSGIQFKRSVIEGQDIDEHEARQICKLVQRLLEARQRRLQTPQPQMAQAQRYA